MRGAAVSVGRRGGGGGLSAGRTLEVGDLPLLPPLGHALELGALTEERVAELTAEGGVGEAERAARDGVRAPIGEVGERLDLSVASVGEEDALAVGEEELEGAVAEEEPALVHLGDVLPGPPPSEVRVRARRASVAAGEVGEGL